MLKTFYILSKSAVARIIFILIISAFTSIITTRRILLSLPCLWFAFSYRYIIFELLVLHHVIDSSLGKWDWYNQVDDDMYLGSIVNGTQKCNGSRLKSGICCNSLFHNVHNYGGFCLRIFNYRL